MTLSDTHTHLDFPDFDQDRQAVIQRAQQSGVELMINIGIDLKTTRKALQIARDNPIIFATAGFHPHNASEVTSESIAQLKTLADDPKIVAVGEVGLDYYRDRSPRSRQQEVFRQMIDLAKQLDLPLVIHTRQAHHDTLEILDEVGIPKRGGVFHCFSGDHQFAKELLSRGFHISFTGNITYNNSPLPQVAKIIPLERTMIETDCPFLAPIPHRGKRSEPFMVNMVARRLAAVHNTTADEVGRICTGAARQLFNIPA
jgi:TatD DNase family protein